jgi:hypothetical protein
VTQAPNAIETAYRGHLFRSRLEARWAAMFDLLGWSWTYEPFDCAGYIPDFVLHGDRPVLVEVKPDLTYEELAKHASRIETAIRGTWKGDYLIVGARVGWYEEESNFTDLNTLGVLGQSGDGLFDGWAQARALWITCEGCTPHRAAFFNEEQWWISVPCGHHDGDRYLGDFPLSRLEYLWGVAHQRTRWTGCQPHRSVPRRTADEHVVAAAAELLAMGMEPEAVRAAFAILLADEVAN